MSLIEAPYPVDGGAGPVQGPDAARLISDQTSQQEQDPLAALSSRDDRQRPLNVRAIIVLALAALIAGTGVHFLHAYQMRRMASVFLDRAELARRREDPQQAAELLGYYLRFRPEDRQARIELALLLDDSAETPRQMYRVIRLFERILREDAEPLPAIRERLVSLYLDFGRYQDARIHLELLLTSDPGRATYWSDLARCRVGLGEYQLAVAALRTAIQTSPRDFESYGRLARLLAFELQRADEADDLLNDMVNAHSSAFDTWLVRARYRRDRGQAQAAVIDAKRAFVLAPNEPGVLTLAAGQLAGESGAAGWSRHFDARDVHHRVVAALADAPLDPGLTLAAAQLDLRLGQPDQAETRLRQALESDPDNLELVWLLADVLLQSGRIEQARQELPRLKELGTQRSALAYLQGRIATADGDWLAARNTFESIPMGRLSSAAVRADLHMELARCYEQLGQSDQQLAAYRSALALDPSLVEARLAEARLLAGLGRVDQALARYRQAPSEPNVAIAVARLLIRQALSRPEADRDWSEVESALNRAASFPANEVESLLLRAGLVSLRQSDVEAATLLERSIQRLPGEVRLRTALADLYQRLDRHEQALEVLEQAEQQLGRRVEIDLARLRHWVRRGDEAAREQVALLEGSAVSGLSSADALIMLQGLGDAWVEFGDLGAAARLWEQVAAREPDNVQHWNRLLEFALRKNDDSQARRVLERIRGIEGEAGANWLIGEASRLVLEAEPGDRSRLEQARVLVEQASRTTDSPRASLLLARVAELRGDDAEAVVRYRDAIDRGESSPEIIQRMVQLLYKRRKFYDAEDLIDRYVKRGGGDLSPSFARLAADVFVRTNNRDEAVALARRGVENSKDYRDHLWLGQVLQSVGQPREAEAALRAALQVDPGRPEPQVALIRLLARQGRLDDARAALAEAERTITGQTRLAALAQCHEVLGETDQAQRLYESALEEHGQDPYVLWDVALFFVRHNRTADAEELLRRLIDARSASSEGHVANARRLLAALLTARGGHPGFLDAVRLLDANLAVDPGSAADLRAKSQVLATRNISKYQREAVSLLLQLGDRVPLSADDQFQLIQRYIAIGSWSDARSAMRALLVGEGHHPDHLAYCIRQVLGHGEIEGAAGGWLNSLEALQPGALRTRELRARQLALAGDVEGALSLLKDVVSRLDASAGTDDADAGPAAVEGRNPSTPAASDALNPPNLLPKPDPDAGDEAIVAARSRERAPAEASATENRPATAADRTRAAARVRVVIAAVFADLADQLERIGRTIDAERLAGEAEMLYREAVVREPALVTSLIRFLGRRWKFQEALALCETAWNDAPAEDVAAVAVELLRSTRSDRDASNRIRARLEAALLATPRSPDLTLQLATIAHLSGDYADAEKLYRRTIELAPLSTVAGNELALLLALRGTDLDESLKLIDRVIEQQGPVGFLLDSRATIYLARGEADRAVGDLQEALREQSTPARHFHLAQAWLARGQETAARTAYRESLAAGLHRESLHPLEAPAYDRLRTQFGGL